MGRKVMWSCLVVLVLACCTSADALSPVPERVQTSVAYSADGKLIAGGFESGTVKVWDARTQKLVGTLTGHGGNVSSLDFSHDGKLLASGSRDGTVKVWKTSGWSLLKTLKHAGPVEDVEFSPNGSVLCAAGTVSNMMHVQPGQAVIWDTKTWEPRSSVLHVYTISSISVSPDSKLLVLGGAAFSTTETVAQRPSSPYGTDIRYQGAIQAPDAAPVYSVPAPSRESARTALASRLSPDGRVYARLLSKEDHQDYVRISEAKTGETIRDILLTSAAKTSGHGVYRVARVLSFSPDSNLLAVWYGGLVILNLRSGKVEANVEGTAEMGTVVEFSPDGKTIAAVSEWIHTGNGNSTSLDVFSTIDWKKLKTFTGHTDWITDLVFSKDSKTLATSSRDGTARVWDLATASQKVMDCGAQAFGVGLSSDAHKVTAICETKVLPVLRKWDLRKDGDGETTGLQSPWGSTPDFQLICELSAFSPDASRVAFYNGSVWIYDCATGERKAELSAEHWNVRRVAFSPDGRMLAGGSTISKSPSENEAYVMLWDTAQGKLVRELPVSGAEAGAQPAFSRDGRRLAAAANGSAVVWDLKTGKEVGKLSGIERPQAAALSPDGKRLAIAENGNHGVRMWNVETGAVLWEINTQCDRLEFSPDGKLLAMVDRHLLVRVVDADSGKTQIVLD